MKRVGIPQGLFYFYYYPLWKTFFTDLGAEVITSSPTSRLTVDRGIEAAVDETCFPIKVYFGHVRELCARKIDYLFLPRLVSIEQRSFICPKFMGVPDMIRAGIDNLVELIDMTIDLSKTDKYLNQEIINTGKLFTRSKAKIQRAYQHACQEMLFCRMLARQGYTMLETINLWEGKQQPEENHHGDLNIGVLGHGYSLYDPTISMNLVQRLKKMGCRVHLVETLDSKAIEAEAASLPKRVFWTLGRKMVGSALHMDKRADIDGIIYLACFGCGPDSLIGEVIERKVKNKAFMLLTVDEHTGEGGLLTRLEAFCDMLRRKGGAGN